MGLCVLFGLRLVGFARGAYGWLGIGSVWGIAVGNFCCCVVSCVGMVLLSRWNGA